MYRVRRLLLDFDPYAGTNQEGLFHLFLKSTTDVLAPHLSVVIQHLLRQGSFLACQRQANVTKIPKNPLSSSVANNRPISITPALTKLFEHLVSVCLLLFMECCGVLPTTQFAYRKCLGTCNALLCVFHTLQNASESGLEVRIVQIDFSAAFDRFNIREFSISSVLWVLEVLCCLC